MATSACSVSGSIAMSIKTLLMDNICLTEQKLTQTTNVKAGIITKLSFSWCACFAWEHGDKEKLYLEKIVFIYLWLRLLIDSRVQLLCTGLAIPVPVTGIATGICNLEESRKGDSGLTDASL